MAPHFLTYSYLLTLTVFAVLFLRINLKFQFWGKKASFMFCLFIYMAPLSEV